MANGMRNNKETGERKEYIKERYLEYMGRDFSGLPDPPPKKRALSA